jgi:hypothetical protein
MGRVGPGSSSPRVLACLQVPALHREDVFCYLRVYYVQAFPKVQPLLPMTVWSHGKTGTESTWLTYRLCGRGPVPHPL